MSKKILMLVLVGLSMVCTACGGGGEPSTKLQVDMVEFMFEPREFTIPAGQEITLELANNGAVDHEFVIMKYGTTVGEDFGPKDDQNIFWEAELGPGRFQTFTFTSPVEPGEYQIVCGTEGHYLAGMLGSLVVRSP